MNAWLIFRLVWAVILCAAGLLVLVRAPTIPLFKVALLVTEFGHWLFVVPLALAFLPTPRTPLHLGATALFLIATILFLSSSIRAAVVARRLPQELARAFPGSSAPTEQGAPPVPFSWKKLWFPTPVPPVSLERLVFAHHDDQELHLDFYCPRHTGAGAAPCVIVIHGGGWENGATGEMPALNHYLAQRGYAVADMEYRFAPRWPWPAQRNDVLDAVEYLRQRAAELHLDPQRFVLLGRSAGGQIAEAVAYGAPRPFLRGCIAFYAPADMQFAYEFGREDDILNSLQLLRQYLGGSLSDVPANYETASAYLLARRESPPTLLIHGRRDELVWFLQSQRFSARLDALGAPHCLVQLPWATHAFDYNFSGPGGQLSTYAVETFLSAVLK